MIACAGGNDTALSFLRRQAQQFIDAATIFEGTRHLQVLEFKQNLTVDHIREGRRRNDRCIDNERRYLVVCMANAARIHLVVCRSFDEAAARTCYMP